MEDCRQNLAPSVFFPRRNAARRRPPDVFVFFPYPVFRDRPEPTALGHCTPELLSGLLLLSDRARRRGVFVPGCAAPRLVFGDTVTVSTNPYRYRNFMGFRNFALDDEKGQRLVAANSIWSLMNLERLLPALITPEHAERLGVGIPFDMDYTDRKIAVPKEGGRILSPVPVDESMLDSNRHVNNAQYVRIALAAMGEPGAPGRLRAEYKKQAFPGDVMHPVLFAGEDGSQTVSLQAEDGSTYAVVSYKTGLLSV